MADNGLIQWLKQQMRKTGLSARKISLRAGMDHAAVSRFLSGTQPTPDSCRALAEFFGVPVDFVLDLAGLIDRPPEMDAFVAEMARLAEHWTPEQKEAWLEMMRVHSCIAQE